MRFKVKVPNKREWHGWFAWYPVRVRNNYVWLEYVQRRDINPFIERITKELLIYPIWEYRPFEGV